MKNNVLTFLLLFCAFFCIAQEKELNYYYYKGQKKSIHINESKLVVYFDENSSLEKTIGSKYDITRKFAGNEYLNYKKQRQKLVGRELKVDSKKYQKTYQSLKTNSEIKAIEQVVGDSIPVAISNIFYVKLKNVSDSVLLYQKAKETKTQVVRRVAFTDKWYVLEANSESISNSLSVSNIFYETGLFDKVDPGFAFDFSYNGVSDTWYSEQWAIDNKGIDINASSAWNMTTGDNDIIIAIIDQGVDNTHSEFIGTNFTMSYDAKSKRAPANLYGDHGTHVCGIISSNHNQAKVTGVAPGVSIMEVSHPLSASSTISEELATGINWAVRNGAHIISCSWGDQGGALYNNLHSELLEDAIDNAIENGRGGLGTIVVFAAGNKAPAIDYPAHYRPEILVVGSITSMGKRSDFSGYGNQLDIVAPGSGILSTIRNNQYAVYDGTSMATPFVSAVAGLILSTSPNLSGLQVANIIESTAQKVGGYNYQKTTGRPNGTWNNQMGYGLVDAYAAVAFPINRTVLN